jgi:ribose transport system substrate-binding protein
MRKWARVACVSFLFVAVIAGTVFAADSKAVQTAWYFPIPHPFGEAVQKGVQAWAKDNGINVFQQIGSEWTQQSQNQNVEALAAKGYKGFAIYPVDPSGANGLYKELVDGGRSVVNFGTSTTVPTPASFAIATDVKAAAMVATERLIELMGGKGNIVNVLEVLADANTILRKQGIEETVAKHPGVRIIQEVGDMSTIEASTEKIENALAATQGQVDGVICTGYTTTVAATQILAERNPKLKKAIAFVGIDDDAVVLNAIRKGTIGGTIAQNPFGMGYLSCEILKLLQSGYAPRSGSYFINSGIVFVTKANVDSYSRDLEKVTKEILGSLKDKYLMKR